MVVTSSDKINSQYKMSSIKNNYELTKQMYPQWAKDGWLFVENIERNLSQTKREQKVQEIQSKLNNTSEYYFLDIIIGLGEEGYKQVKVSDKNFLQPDQTVMPVFIKMYQNKDLKLLGCSVRIIKMRIAEKQKKFSDYNINLD